MAGTVLATHQLGRFRIAYHLLGLRIEADDASHARGDVAQMAQSGGQVTDFDVGIRLSDAPGTAARA
jgi:hypothetical protein